MSRTQRGVLSLVLSAGLALASACAADAHSDADANADADFAVRADAVVAVDVDANAEITQSCGSNLPIAAVSASGAQDGNPATHVIDGDLSTRWAQNEVGATLTADLGTVNSVCGVSIAWYMGTQRVSEFALALSKDGSSFTEVTSDSSSGNSEQFEHYSFAARDARYLRLSVNGNSENDWASVTGLAIAGTDAAAVKLSRAERDQLTYGDYKPSAATVGPVPEATLTLVGTPSTSTDVIATANNQVIQNLEIWGRIDLKSYSGVTIRDCIIHGPLARKESSHIIGTSNDLRGATIIDSALVGRSVTVPASYNDVPNPDAGKVNQANEWVAGVSGANFTLLRTEIRNVVDGLSLNSAIGNVSAKGNWIHEGWMNEWTAEQGGKDHYYPRQGSDYTYADAIQFHRGRNYTIVGNVLGGVRVPGNHHASPSEKDLINSGDDMFNAALMIKQEVDDTPANKLEIVLIDRNWILGGRATVNMSYSKRNNLSTVELTNNRFVKSTWGQQYYIMRSKDSDGQPIGVVTGNVFEDGTAVPISNGG